MWLCRCHASPSAKKGMSPSSRTALKFRSGNPRPQGTADDIIAQGKKFYDELSPETSEFQLVVNAVQLGLVILVPLAHRPPGSQTAGVVRVALEGPHLGQGVGPPGTSSMTGR